MVYGSLFIRAVIYGLAGISICESNTQTYKRNRFVSEGLLWIVLLLILFSGSVHAQFTNNIMPQIPENIGEYAGDNSWKLRENAEAILKNRPVRKLSVSERQQRGLADGAGEIIRPSSGTVQDFWVFNDTVADGQKVSFRLRYSGEYCYIWLEDSSEPTEEEAEYIQNLIYEFDNNIYSTVREFFGEDWPEGGVDGDPAIHLALYTFDSASTYGYFIGINEFLNADLPAELQKSNEREMLYLNWTMIKEKMDRPEFAYGVLAHEFQHLVHFYQGVLKHALAGQTAESELTWFNEGCSELSVRVCGYGQPDSLRHFEKLPFFSLVEWEGYMHNYGGSYSFVSYINDRFGSSVGNADFIKALVGDPKSSFGAIKEHLPEGETPEKVMVDWATANLIDNPNLGDARWGHRSLDINVRHFLGNTIAAGVFEKTYSSYPLGRQQLNVNYWGAGYTRFSKPYWPDYNMHGTIWMPEPSVFGASSHDETDLKLQLRAVWFNDVSVEIQDISTAKTGSGQVSFQDGTTVNVDLHEFSIYRKQGYEADSMILIPVYTALEGKEISTVSGANSTLVSYLSYFFSIGRSSSLLTAMLNPVLPHEMLLIADTGAHTINSAVLKSPDGSSSDITMEASETETRYFARKNISDSGDYTFTVETTGIDGLSSLATFDFFVTDVDFFSAQVLSPPNISASINMTSAPGKSGRLMLSDNSSYKARQSIDYLIQKGEVNILGEPFVIDISNSLPEGTTIVPSINDEEFYTVPRPETGVFRFEGDTWKLMTPNKNVEAGIYAVFSDSNAPDIKVLSSMPGILEVEICDEGSGLNLDRILLETSTESTGNIWNASGSENILHDQKIPEFEFVRSSYDKTVIRIYGNGEIILRAEDMLGNDTRQSMAVSAPQNPRIQSLTVTPNPAPEEMTIKVKADGTMSALNGSIYDSTGMLVHRIMSSDWFVTGNTWTYEWYPSSDEANGVYFIKVKSDNGSTGEISGTVLR